MDISYKNICRITFPVLLSLLVEQIIGITDTAFLGHVGEVELGASAIAGICYLILFVIGSGFGVGLQVLVARLNGESEKRQITSIFSTGLYFLVVMAIAVIVISQQLLPYILRTVIQSDAIYDAALRYLDWRIYGLLFSFMIIAFRTYYVGITQTRFLTVNSIVMVAVNVLCNYVLVFGKWGFPAWGIEGAGLGSCLAEFVAALLFFVYYGYTKKGCLFDSLRDIRRQWHCLKRILKLSVWTMIQSFISLSTWFLFFIVIERIGEEPLAISNIVRSICTMPFIFAQAFALTGSSLVSNLIGEGKADKVLPLCKRIIAISYMFCIPLLVIGGIIPGLLLGLYTNNPSLIAGAIVPFFVMLSSFFLTVPASVFYSAIAGTGNTFMPLKVGLSALAFYVAYILFIANTNPDIALLWMSEHVYALAIFILSLIYMLRGNWRQKAI